MNIKRFIDRPILSGVISVVIVFMGLIGLTMLPVEQYPEIAPPTIGVSASYTGADAATVQRSVIVPIEEALNGVENMLYMTSSAGQGTASLSVYFKQGTDPSMAMVNVQNYIAAANGLLPSEVTQSGVTVRKRQPANLKILAINSPDGRYDASFLVNYSLINLEPQLARVNGVGSVDVLGSKYALRIWLDPHKMAQYSLMPSDITTVLSEQNIEYPTGTVGDGSEYAYQYDLKYSGRLEENTDYENLVIKSTEDGKILRLKDVARIELGSQAYETISYVSGAPSTTIMISQTAGANANEVITGIDELVEELRKDLPEGIEIVDLFSTKDFLDASIWRVMRTLLEAMLLVILVVYVFLQSFRSTIIPMIAIFVSLIGTFSFIYFAGFSINLLTLFALVLVIGTVVDDAIVVVEAVQNRFDAGEKSPYRAAVGGMGDIASALITTSIVFMAVFIPVCFIGGTSGKFYTQFGLTMAVAVAFSTVNALTLSPALCALIMTPHKELKPGEKASFSSRFHTAFESAFANMVDRYKKQVFLFLKYKHFSFLLVLLAGGALYYLMSTSKTALVPNEDTGSMYISVQTAVGTSKAETSKIMFEIEEQVKSIPEIKAYSMNIGRGLQGLVGSNNGMFVIRLQDWSLRSEQGQDVWSVQKRIYAKTAHITEASIMVMTPPMISGYGMVSGFELHVQDRTGGTMEDLYGYTQEIIQRLSQRPEISRVQSTFNNNYPQYMLNVDAALCERNGVSPADVLSTISGYVGGSYVSNMNKFSKLYRVMLQAPIEERLSIEVLENLYVRGNDGNMSPVSNYVTTERVFGASTLYRFNMFPSIQVSGSPQDGYSSGQAIQAVREVAAEVLPAGYSYEFGSMSREEAAGGSNATAIIFAICLIFVYLILCALYESLLIPFAVILSIPFGLMGSFLFARMAGLSNDIYLQTGLIMLIGLLAKTAILLTEYASERRREGMPIVQAAIVAAKVRLRPILMTSLTLIFGMLPLVFASGVGANGNMSLGIGVVGGMLIGTIALIFVVPALFVIFQGIQEYLMPTRVLPKIEENTPEV